MLSAVLVWSGLLAAPAMGQETACPAGTEADTEGTCSAPRQEGVVGSWMRICEGVREGRPLGKLQWAMSTLRPKLTGDMQFQANSDRWGNALSTYWQARGIAALAGIAFEGAKPPDGSPWVHLPTEVPPNETLRNDTALREVCEACKDIVFAHECAGGWRYIRPAIQKETLVAFKRFAKAAGKKLPEPRRGEVIVHLRLQFNHRQIAWPGRGSFEGRIPANTSRILILHQPYQPHHRGGAPGARRQLQMMAYRGKLEDVDTTLEGYKKLLGAICNCPVATESGEPFWDFASMLRTRKALFCSGSSFCMWAAMGNKHAHVWMPGGQNWGGNEHPFVDDTFHWDLEQRLENHQVMDFNKMPVHDFLQWVETH